MSDLDNAINSINASAAKAENTATFLDDMSTFDDQSSVTNPNNGQTVASISKQVKDRTDELFTDAESDINQAVSDAAQSATDAQDAADSIGRYQGLWPDTDGSADKGDTYQTQVGGTPTGQYFTALQNTTADPVGDDVNWHSINNHANLTDRDDADAHPASAIFTTDGRNVQERLDDLPSEVDAAGTAATLISQHNSDATAHPELSAFITAEADRAEVAADAATVSGNVYVDTTAGIAATVSGDYFSVVSPSDDNYLDLYKNESNVAVFKKSYPSTILVNNTISQLSTNNFSLGYPDDSIPVGTSSLDNSNYVIANPMVNDGFVSKVNVHCGNAGTLKLRVWDRVGDTFTVSNERIVSVVQGLQTINTSIPYVDGQYFGFTGSGTVMLLGRPADDGGWYAGGAGGSSFTDSTPSTSLSLMINVYTLNLDRLDRLEVSVESKAEQSELNDLKSDLYTVATYKVGVTPASAGSSIDNSLYALAPASPKNGTVKRVIVNTTGEGTLRVMTFSKSSDVFTVVNEQTVAIQGGVESIDIDIPIVAGQYVGFQSNKVTLVSGVNSNGWYGSVGADSFVDGTITTSSQLQIGFDVEYSEIALGGESTNYGVNLPFKRMMIIGVGQSLMEGSQTPTNGQVAITTSQEFDTLGFQAYPSTPNELRPATVVNTQRATNRGEWPGLGCAYKVRELLLTENNLRFEDVESTIVVGNNAVGGAKISEISKGTAAYNSAISQAGNLETLSGVESGVLAIIFGQGESDSAVTDRVTYKNSLISLSSDYNTDVKAATGQSKSTKLFCYQMNQTGREIGLAQLDAANESSLINMVCPLYQFDYYDTLHINSESSRWLGGYYAKAIKQTTIDGIDFEPLKPIDLKVIGDSIILTYNKSGLVIDEVNMPAQQNSGYTVFDDVGSAVGIVSVSIVNLNQVKIVCSSQPMSNWVVKYGVSTSGKAPFIGLGGNVRDNDGVYNQIDGKPLHNWSVIFDMEI